MGETDNANDEYFLRLMADPKFIVIVAMLKGEVVGGMTAYELPMYYAESSEVLIYDIAVKPKFHRKGVGKKILTGLKEYCELNGIKVFFVEAHHEDKHAVDFYKSIGGMPEKVVHFNFDV
jgi:aminoglycoside 3-N-acetyltransferase I